MKNNLLFGCLISGLFSFAQVTNPTPIKKKHVEILKEYAEIMQTRSTAFFLPGYMDTYMYFNGYQLQGRNEYNYIGNHIATDTYAYYDNGSFFPSSRTRYTYTATYDVVNYDWWDSDAETWFEFYVDSTFFDAQGNTIKSSGYEYDQLSANWIFNWGESVSYTYSASNEMLSATYASLDENGVGTSEYREIWTWTGGNGPSSGIFQYWDTDASAWMDDMRATDILWFKFSEFKLTAATVQFWDETAWENAFQLEASYFSNGIEELLIERNWNGTAFVNSTKSEQTIDANEQLTSYSSFYWDEDNWDLSFAREYTNTYAANEALIQVDEAEYEFQSELFEPSRRFVYGNHINIASLNESVILVVTVYPNPVQDKLNVILEDETTSFEIMNLAGQTLISGLASGITSIDVAALAQGMYVLKLYNGHQANAIKFMKN